VYKDQSKVKMMLLLHTKIGRKCHRGLKTVTGKRVNNKFHAAYEHN